METFEFGKAFLQHAKDITLADLLDTPFTQAFTFSMIVNSVNGSHNFEMERDSDLLLASKLRQIVNKIPRKERFVLYDQCNRLIAIRRERNEANRAHRKQVTD